MRRTLQSTYLPLPVAMALSRKPTKHLPHLLPALARRVRHVAQLEPVELAGSTDRIRTHLVPPEPVPDLQPTRQPHRLAHQVHRIAGRPPHAARRHGLRSRHMERPIHGQNVWRHDLVIEQRAVERAVHPVVNVVCIYSISAVPMCSQAIHHPHMTLGSAVFDSESHVPSFIGALRAIIFVARLNARDT